MQLKNNLYTIVGREGDATAATFRLALHPECFIYKAHFPGQPITPGVCIVQTVAELMEEMTGKRLHVVFVKNVKFLSVISPDDTTGLTCQISRVAWADDAREVKAQATVSTLTETKAKVSLVCRVHDAHHH